MERSGVSIVSEEEIKHLNEDEIMLECVKLILQKNNIHRLEDLLIESKKLFNFIKNKGDDV